MYTVLRYKLLSDTLRPGTQGTLTGFCTVPFITYKQQQVAYIELGRIFEYITNYPTVRRGYSWKHFKRLLTFKNRASYI